MSYSFDTNGKQENATQTGATYTRQQAATLKQYFSLQLGLGAAVDRFSDRSLWDCTIVYNPQFMTPENAPSFCFDLRKQTAKYYGGSIGKKTALLFSNLVSAKI